MQDTVVETRDLRRSFWLGGREIPVLQGVDLAVPNGRFVVLRGRSGSGKTTLLNCIGGLDRPTSGSIQLNGREVSHLPERTWVQIRRQQIGFIFQSYALLAAYSARENVDMMLRLAGVGRREREARTVEVLTQVGLANWMDHRPFELSGGQQQRVAIARALAPRPALLLADEPTGKLDTTTGDQILQLFREVVAETGMTVMVATHDVAVNALADVVYELEDGRLN